MTTMQSAGEPGDWADRIHALTDEVRDGADRLSADADRVSDELADLTPGDLAEGMHHTASLMRHTADQARAAAAAADRWADRGPMTALARAAFRLLREHDLLSDEEMARLAGWMNKATCDDAISQLRQAGVEVETVRGEGWRLARGRPRARTAAPRDGHSPL